jgi:hypothetical protein
MVNGGGGGCRSEENGILKLRRKGRSLASTRRYACGVPACPLL